MDTDLVTRARQGDQAAFASIAEESYGRLHRVAFAILRDRALAEDATQQAMLTAWRELSKLRDPDRFEAWTYRLVVNACHAETRRARRWIPNLPIDVSRDAFAGDGLGAIADRDQLERGFRKLSVDHRAVVVLRHYAGHSEAEVAAILDIPPGTVRSRLYRAMQILRSALEADERPTGTIDASPQEVTR